MEITAYDSSSTAYDSSSPALKGGKWTQEEDDRLRRAVEYYGEKHWRLVSAEVGIRSSIQCLHRWSKILKPGLVKGAWSDEEDDALRDFVKQFGASNWAEAVNYIHGRSSKQCRERWNNILNPNVKKG